MEQWMIWQVDHQGAEEAKKNDGSVLLKQYDGVA